MNFVEDHPWIMRFVSAELVLIVIAIILFSLTGSTPTSNPLDWNPIKITGLLVGAFSIIIGVFGLVVGIVYASSRFS